MKREFTAVIEKKGRWYLGTVEEIPGANTQGRTLPEMRRNLKEAIHLILEANRSIPRHREIDGFLARKICRDLGISSPS